MSNKNISVEQALPEFYLPFAGYVVQTRALPDARDGLKTGARYILIAQERNKNTYKHKLKKSVNTVGATMTMNPHGDAPIYENIVRMAQPFSMRYMLQDPHGNMGTITGFPAAASRYTETRSAEVVEEMTKLLPKNVVPEKYNFAQEFKIPTVLPSIFPNSLVNGNVGIGVGMASSIPQFNLTEVCDKLVVLLENPNSTFEELYCAPDFATGGIIMNESQVKESLKHGEGKTIIHRAVMEYLEDENAFLVTEVPYGVTTRAILQNIGKGVENGYITGIKDAYDATDIKDGKLKVRLHIQLEKGALVEEVARQLYRYTRLQEHHSVNIMMLQNGLTPKRYGWKEMMCEYLDFLKDIKRKAFEFDLKEITDQIHILQGYIKATENIDEVVKTIRASKDKKEAKSELISKFSFSDAQSEAILRMQLQRLININAVQTQKDLDNNMKKMNTLALILRDERSFNKEIEKEITRIKNKYGDNRRTKIMDLKVNTQEEIFEEKEITAYITSLGRIKTEETTSLVAVNRGAKGRQMKLNENEEIIGSITVSNFSQIMVFTDTGYVYSFEGVKLPVGETISLAEVTGIELSNEKIVSILPKKDVEDKEIAIVTYTKNGRIKQTSIGEYNSNRKAGVVNIKLNDGDEVVGAKRVDTSVDSNLLQYTKKGQLVLSDDTFESTGRLTKGVLGTSLNDGDELVGVDFLTDEEYLLVIHNDGSAKRTPVADITVLKQRRGKGVKGAKDAGIMKVLPIPNGAEAVTVITPTRRMAIKLSTIPSYSRTAGGVKFVEDEIRGAFFD